MPVRKSNFSTRRIVQQLFSVGYEVATSAYQITAGCRDGFSGRSSREGRTARLGGGRWTGGAFRAVDGGLAAVRYRLSITQRNIRMLLSVTVVRREVDGERGGSAGFKDMRVTYVRSVPRGRDTVAGFNDSATALTVSAPSIHLFIVQRDGLYTACAAHKYDFTVLDLRSNQRYPPR